MKMPTAHPRRTLSANFPNPIFYLKISFCETFACQKQIYVAIRYFSIKYAFEIQASEMVMK